ncbi:MAG: hypothetical protein WDN28_30580 [Chthoniobacter sp.]
MALIITLFFLVLVSIVVVGFIDTARVDRIAAGSHFERMRAQTFAAEGIETVMATLQRETCDPPYTSGLSTYIPRNWLSAPGLLVTTDPNASSATRLAKQVPLSSGAPSAAYLADSGIDLVMRPPDLNAELLVEQATPTHLLTEQEDATTHAAMKMKVRWVYVRKDGSYDLGSDGLPTEAPTLTNTANPIVGRFAYWTDDESTKINYNLAWTRDPTLNKNPPGHPTKVDLRALPLFTDSIANSLHGFITPDNYATVKRFFNSPFDARLQADTDMRTALDQNKFALTHYNSDPDTTYYGLPRMILTTQLSNAVVRDAAGNPVMDGGKPVTRPFLDILKNPSNSLSYIDPGVTTGASVDPPGNTGNVDATKLNTVVHNLIDNYLQRADWPMVDGAHSIQEKYYNRYSAAQQPERLAQLALNIIDYVRSAESRLNVVQPIRAKWIGGTYPNAVFTPDFIDSSIQGTEDTFKGLTRAPHITELGMWVSDTPETSGVNAGRYRSVVLTEVYLPPNYGLDTLDLAGTDGRAWSLYIGEVSATYTDNSTGVAVQKALYYGADGKAAVNENTVKVPKNPTSSPAFVWEAQTDANQAKMTPDSYRTLALEVYRAKSKKDMPTVTLRSAITLAGGPRIDVAPLAAPLSYTLAGTGAELSVNSYENADPRVNGLTKDWTLDSQSTFGQVNAARVKSLAAPMTNGDKPVLPPQDVDSTGKISTASMRMPYPAVKGDTTKSGRVFSSGELGLIHTGIEGSNSAPQPGVPWRSLHLQPTSQATTTVPDWAFMDLFTVPMDIPVAASGIFSPHSNSAGGRVNVNAKPAPFDLERTDPLAAVFNGALKSTLNSTTLTATEAKTIAQNIYNHTLASAGTLPAGKLYPANSSNLNYYESPGEIVEIAGVADKGEESEQLVREVANLITARGNVFAVYTVGQALKQTPNGKLVVTGEQRQEAMIERYMINKGTANLTDDSVGLRTVYFRNLLP